MNKNKKHFVSRKNTYTLKKEHDLIASGMKANWSKVIGFELIQISRLQISRLCHQKIENISFFTKLCSFL